MEISLTIELDEDMKRKIEQHAEDLGVEVQDLLEALIARGLIEDRVMTVQEVVEHFGSFASTAVILDIDPMRHY